MKYLSISQLLFLHMRLIDETLILNHPMVDGNKRVSISAAALFLERNGHRLTATNDELEVFTLRVAEGLADVKAIAEWLRDKTWLVM